MDREYVDLQVNGYMGIDFSAPDLTIEDIHKVSTFLSEKGVVAYCPTVVTSSTEVYRHNLPLIASVTKNGGPGAQVLGVHLEGPFLSPETGARGIHQAQHIRRPDISFYQQLEELCEGSQALITIAPDQAGAAK